MAATAACSRSPALPGPGAAPFLELDGREAGFLPVIGPISLDFPADLGGHPDYLIEWWYYTGNLETETGRHFGYQLTIFRQALTPDNEPVERASAWASNQIYFAHLTLTDVSGGQFLHFEKFARGGPTAGYTTEPFGVWLENWHIQQTEDAIMLQAQAPGLMLDLALEDQKGLYLRGFQGYSQRGEDPENASIYFSQPRLSTTGQISVDGAVFEVSGSSWMDHEFSSTLLGAGQVGWDWFAFQLSDGSELVVVHIRLADGTIDPFSSGAYIDSNGGYMPLSADAFEIDVKDTWTSPNTAARYPAGWEITVPDIDLTLTVKPYLANQELLTSTIYWEGAVEITGNRADQDVFGWGYAELTGYAVAQVDK
jgi:predicted secreted hydrolase